MGAESETNEDVFDVEGVEAEAEVETTEAAEQSTGSVEAIKADEASENTSEADEKAAAEAALKAAADKELAEAFAKFEQAVAAAMADENRDHTTGTLPEAVKHPVVQAYGQLPGNKGKTQGKKLLQEAMQAKMLEGPDGFPDARSYLELFNAVQAGTPKETVVRKPVDPTDAFVASFAALYLAPQLLAVPSGVAEDWKQRASAKVESLKGDMKAYSEWYAANAAKDPSERAEAPEVDEIVLRAAKHAALRAERKRPVTPRAEGSERVATGDVTRGNIRVHLAEFFATKPVGEFHAIADMTKFVSSEYGGDKAAPSPGAIAAQLFPAKGESKLLGWLTPEVQGRKGASRSGDVPSELLQAA